jgi:hypothetical protein
VRTPRGRDILAACGQLKTASEKKSRAELDRQAEEKQAALGLTPIRSLNSPHRSFCLRSEKERPPSTACKGAQDGLNKSGRIAASQ